MRKLCVLGVVFLLLSCDGNEAPKKVETILFDGQLFENIWLTDSLHFGLDYSRARSLFLEEQIDFPFYLGISNVEVKGYYSYKEDWVIYNIVGDSTYWRFGMSKAGLDLIDTLYVNDGTIMPLKPAYKKWIEVDVSSLNELLKKEVNNFCGDELKSCDFKVFLQFINFLHQGWSIDCGFCWAPIIADPNGLIPVMFKGDTYPEGMDTSPICLCCP